MDRFVYIEDFGIFAYSFWLIKKKCEMKLLVEKVISGGQTGVDMAGLIAAKDLGIKTGGWIPRGFKTENGNRPDLGTIYELQEHESDQYPPRTMKNVDDSDGTIAFLLRNSVGTLKTIGYCHTHDWRSRSTSKFDGYRPVLVITKITDKTVEEIRAFIAHNDIHILNVAGHRESSFQGIQERIANILREALKEE